MSIFESQESENHWISVSDLMSVLMMIFLFIAITYMLQVQAEKQRIQEVAVTYNKLQNQLFLDLYDEFEADLPRWNAVIDRQSLSIRFEAPEVLFQSGSAALEPAFRTILADFFPRYIAILSQPQYRNEIEEIRIEGHTSSEWSVAVSKENAYFYNMELSQDRTREVLRYCMDLRQVQPEWSWMKEKFTANGLSSSKLVRNAQGREDYRRSRRVEFRVRTNAEQRMVKILTADL